MIDVLKSRELQATILALRQMDREVRKRFFKAMRTELVPAWRQVLSANATSSLEERIIASKARVDVTPETIRLKAAQSVKKMSGGASAVSLGHAVEFGAAYRRGDVEATSRTGKAYRYERGLNRQFKSRRRQGYVAWPSAAEVAPRFAALSVQLLVRTMYDAIERKF